MKCPTCWNTDMGSEWIDTDGADGNEDALLYTCPKCGYRKVKCR
jgi:predicted nucleic-acid-binding Zn-ribbon protein